MVRRIFGWGNKKGSLVSFHLNVIESLETSTNSFLYTLENCFKSIVIGELGTILLLSSLYSTMTKEGTINPRPLFTG